MSSVIITGEKLTARVKELLRQGLVTGVNNTSDDLRGEIQMIPESVNKK
jgi:hypothetical protein